MVTWSGALGPDLRGYRKLVTLVFFLHVFKGGGEGGQFSIIIPQSYPYSLYPSYNNYLVSSTNVSFYFRTQNSSGQSMLYPSCFLDWKLK